MGKNFVISAVISTSFLISLPESSKGGLNNLNGFPNAPAPHGPPISNTAPLDGGLSILLAAGAAVGIKKAYQKRKKAKSLR